MTFISNVDKMNNVYLPSEILIDVGTQPAKKLTSNMIHYKKLLFNACSVCRALYSDFDFYRETLITIDDDIFQLNVLTEDRFRRGVLPGQFTYKTNTKSISYHIRWVYGTHSYLHLKEEFFRNHKIQAFFIPEKYAFYVENVEILNKIYGASFE